MINITKQITIYKDVFNLNSKIHAWRPIEDLSETNLNLQSLKDIIGINFSFNADEYYNYKFDEMNTIVNNSIIAYFNSLFFNKFIFVTESFIQTSNRVRSFKGIVNKSLLDKSDYIQMEVPILENYTLFGAIIKIDLININYLLNFFKNSETSFIISGESLENIMSENFIKSIIINMMNHKGTSNINYLKLISQLCLEGHIIHRIGGDKATIETDFQIFSLDEKKEIILPCLKG